MHFLAKTMKNFCKKIRQSKIQQKIANTCELANLEKKTRNPKLTRLQVL